MLSSVLCVPRLDDGARDAPGVALFAKLAQHGDQLGFAHPAQVFPGGLPGRPVHAHVERTGPAERKAALGFVELGGGDPQVDQATVQRKRPRRGQHLP